MANPQLEDGFTSLTNSLWEALARIRIPGEARQILDTIIRLQYGYHHKDPVPISLSKFVLVTGMKKCSVIRAIHKLEVMQLIYVKVNGGVSFYSFIKDYDKWKPFTKKQIVYEKVNHDLLKSKSTVYEKVNEHIKGIKETRTKEITKEIINTNVFIPQSDFEHNLKKCLDSCQKIKIPDSQLLKVSKLWESLYKNQFDLPQEIQKAELWLITNKRTKSNYVRYLTNWFNCELDKGKKGGNYVRTNFNVGTNQIHAEPGKYDELSKPIAED